MEVCGQIAVHKYIPPEHHATLTRRLQAILKRYRVITTAPALTCAISIHPKALCPQPAGGESLADACLSTPTPVEQHDMDTPSQANPQQALRSLQHRFHVDPIVLFKGSTGYRDLDTLTKAQPDDMMMIASISKLVTSVMVGRLSHAGLLSVHQTIGPLLRDSRYWEHGMSTVARLFNHCKYPWSRTSEIRSSFRPIPHPLTLLADRACGESNDSNSNINSTACQSSAHDISALDSSSKTPSPEPSGGGGHSIQSIPQPSYLDSITIAQLLSHTAGIRDYNPDTHEFYSHVSYPSVFTSLLGFVFDNQIPYLGKLQSTQPGATRESTEVVYPYSYTTLGYPLVAAAIEAVCAPRDDGAIPRPHSTYGPSFAVLLQRLITVPLSLPCLYVEMTRGSVLDRPRLTEYMRVANRPGGMPTAISNTHLAPVVADKSNGNAGGSMVSTPESLARLGVALTTAFVHGEHTTSFVSQSYLNNAMDWSYHEYERRYRATKIDHTAEYLPHHSGEKPTRKTEGIPSPVAYGLGCLNYHNTIQASLDAMLSTTHNLDEHYSSFTNPAHTAAMGFGDDPLLYHTGSGIGSSTCLLVALHHGISVSVFANVGGISVLDCCVELAGEVRRFLAELSSSKGDAAAYD